MGNVPKSKRKESAIEFDNNYFRVYNDCLMVCSNDFGYSRMRYAEKYAPKKVDYQTEEYNQAMQMRFQKKLNTIETFLNIKKGKCAQIVEDMLDHLKKANSIFPTSLTEYYDRRLEQDKAIGCCFNLLTQYQIAMRIADAKADSYILVIENLDKEINSIKKWRESDNRFKRKLVGK